MKKLLIAILLVPMLALANVKQETERQVEALISTQENLSVTTNNALRAIFKITVKELKRRNHKQLAKQIETEWRFFDGYIIEAVLLQRDIGWFEPMSEWLALTYESIELAMGYEATRALRISDIKTINHGIMVVFRPCKFGFQEFEKHFVHDDRYRGFAPVVVYWSTAIGCTVALHGAGYIFVCSPAALVLERLVDKRIAPRVAPKLYDLACTL